MTVWPSGLRRRRKAPFRKGEGSNPTAVTVSALFGEYAGLPRALAAKRSERPERGQAFHAVVGAGEAWAPKRLVRAGKLTRDRPENGYAGI